MCRYALLPILSSSKLGHFGPYANNAACVGIGGKGILAHDLYQFYNVVFFIPCTGITFFSLYKSIRISGALLAPPNLQMRQSTVSHIVAVRAERRMMWFSVSMSALFLLCWLGHAVFFTHAILGIEYVVARWLTCPSKFFFSLTFLLLVLPACARSGLTGRLGSPTT